MELITLSLGYIVNTLAKNQEVQGVVDDFVSASTAWIRGWFNDGEQDDLVSKLEKEPDNVEVQKEMQEALTNMA